MRKPEEGEKIFDRSNCLKALNNAVDNYPVGWVRNGRMKFTQE